MRATLRKRVRTVDAVVQLVGQSYGPAPEGMDTEFGECSYTQFEALCAEKAGKPVWRLVLDKVHPKTGSSADTNAERCLQECYRDKVLATDKSARRSGSLEDTVQFIRDIRAEFPEAPRPDRTRMMRYFPIINLVFVAAIVLGVISGGFRNLAMRFTPESSRLATAVNLLPAWVLNWPGSGRKGDQLDWVDDAYRMMEQHLVFDTATLRPKLETFVVHHLKREDLTRMERANALFCGNQYLDAEAMAAEVAGKALKNGGSANRDAIVALGLAGISAWADRRNERALEYFRAATALVDKKSAPVDWADLKWREAFILDVQGQYAEAVEAYRPIRAVLQAQLEPDNSRVLMCLNNLANSLRLDRKFQEAEEIHRAVLARREKGKGGRESPDCLISRRNIAWTLEGAGRYDAAMREYEALFDIQLRVLGADHEDTLQTRASIGGVLLAQGKLAEAEERFKILLPLLEKKLGAWHLQTMTAWWSMAGVWSGQGRYAEAEKAYRSVLWFAQRNWGAKHSDTLIVRNDLGVALLYQQKYAEATKQFKTVVDAYGGPSVSSEQPVALVACGYLSLCLEGEGRLVEGLAQAERAESGWKKLISESGDWVEHTWLRFATTARERIQKELTVKN